MSTLCPLRTPRLPLQGLAPVVGGRPRVLVLGSMPGAESLRRGQYYAHPRNDFWRIVEDLYGIARSLPYADRTVALADAGVALWDVLAACHRHGSLDAGIERDGRQFNDIPRLLGEQPTIARVAFNGIFADTLFRRRFAAALPRPDLAMLRLPSTSPANASRRYSEKLAAWRDALGSPG